MDSPKLISLISGLVNLGLAVSKFIIGFFSHSIALMAEGLHSGLDVVSSFVTFFGVRAKEKPADKEHPYGYERYESLAGLIVVGLLFVSACWILFEVVQNILAKETVAQFTFWGIILMALSAIVNEVMARLKFSIGNKFSSLALVADAEHSRADVYSSLAVLAGLFLVKFYPLADSILAALVAFYIFYEVYYLSREVVDSLVDKANPELEEKIKSILEKASQKFSKIKTRKIGASNFAEISLIFDPREKIENVTNLTKRIKEMLIGEIDELKQVSILVESHDISEGVVRPQFGGRFHFRGRFKKLEPRPEKKGRRTAIPLENGEISLHFGALEYLIIDIDENKNISKKTVKNDYYESADKRRGVLFIKSVGADKVIAKHISEPARENLEAQNIEIKIVERDKKLDDLLNNLKDL